MLYNFKKVDLIFFTFLAMATELISSLSFSKLNSGFYFSFAILIFVVFSIRWGKIAVVSFVLSGIPLLFTEPNGHISNIGYRILFYVLTNIFAVIPILIYGKRSRNRIATSPLWLSLYVLSVILSLSIGKELALLIINKDPLGGVAYFVSQIFTLILTILILIILSRLKTKLVFDMTENFEEKVEEDDFKGIKEKGESETNEQNSSETRQNEENFA